MLTIFLPDDKHSSTEQRKLVLGATNNKRMLAVVFTIRSTKVRVISARDMNKKERGFYEETINTNSGI